MRQYLFLIIALLLGMGLWGGVHLSLWHKPPEQLPLGPFAKSQFYLPGSEFEEELMFFLARQTGIYEGEFEIIDVVNLETRNIAGMDYILVTIRAPNGNLCQVTIAKEASPWAQWAIVPDSFSLVKLPEASIKFSMDTPRWMQDLGITPEQVAAYFQEHPDMKGKGAAAFFNKQTQSYILPVDWFESVKKTRPLRLGAGKNKQITVSSLMVSQSQIGLMNAYWKADYPSDYGGPGYRAYLYGKSKGEQ